MGVLSRFLVLFAIASSFASVADATNWSIDDWRHPGIGGREIVVSSLSDLQKSRVHDATHVSFRDLKDDVARSAASTFAGGPAMKSVTFRGMLDFGKEALQAILDGTRAHAVEICSCPKLPSDLLGLLLARRSVHELTFREVREFVGDVDESFELTLEGLTKFSMTRCAQPGSRVWREILNSLRAKYLVIDELNWVTFDHLRLLDTSGLCSLVIRRCDQLSARNCWQWIQRIANLGMLAFDFQDGLTDGMIRSLKGLSGLKGLSLQGSAEVRWTAIGDLAQLQSLDMSHCPALGDGMPGACGVLQSLQSLRLEGISLASTDIRAVAALAQLTELDISHCKVAETTYLGQLAGCRRLVYLNIDGLDAVCGAGWLAQLTSLKCLSAVLRGGPSVAVYEELKKCVGLTAVRIGASRAHPRLQVDLLGKLSGLTSIELVNMTLDAQCASWIASLAGLVRLSLVAGQILFEEATASLPVELTSLVSGADLRFVRFDNVGGLTESMIDQVRKGRVKLSIDFTEAE